jgi:hypothetical protein
MSKLEQESLQILMPTPKIKSASIKQLPCSVQLAPRIKWWASNEEYFLRNRFHLSRYGACNFDWKKIQDFRTIRA